MLGDSRNAGEGERVFAKSVTGHLLHIRQNPVSDFARFPSESVNLVPVPRNIP